MKKVIGQKLLGERAEFFARDASYEDCLFAEGESPLKEGKGIEAKNCTFAWKYPLWYDEDVKIDGCLWNQDARAGGWYGKNIEVRNSRIEAPKNFRRCENLVLENVDMENANEGIWACKNVKIKGLSAKGDYLCMNCEDVEVEDLNLVGGYSFDGCKRVRAKRLHIQGRDAFWNCEDVVVEDSWIEGAYISWNTHNITFKNCVLSSLQGFCYLDGIKMVNCRLAGTSLAFEYCANCDVEGIDRLDSLKNPISGEFHLADCGELILEKERVDLTKSRLWVGGKKIL